uniref:Ig-like domain-containing protein n=1 Tax=Xiphophorus couchianus TaxID=32473 RepID=A0A3B5MVS5_9TELE
ANKIVLIMFYVLLIFFSPSMSATATADHYDVSVSRGSSVMLTCNISEENTTMIKWTKDRWYFAYSSSSNQTFSNFSSHRLRIDTNIPSTLSIDNAQNDDAGLYSCNINGNRGFNYMTWTVTVLEDQNVWKMCIFFLHSIKTKRWASSLSQALKLIPSRSVHQSPQIRPRRENVMMENQALDHEKSNFYKTETEFISISLIRLVISELCQSNKE